MIKRGLFSFCLIFLTNLSANLYAQEPVSKNFAYFGLEPDIVTNYMGSRAGKLGYIRITVELMLEDADYLSIVEHHAPLLRATVIEILGRQPEERIKSLTGRENIRRTFLETMRDLMKEETGSNIIKDVIFTKYIYFG
ncbi:MAG: flagellar FliL protein [Paraglaciecola sp.]|jgi:flagellar FliL protein